MTDYFLELAKNPLAQKIASKLPITVNLPPVLQREDSAWRNQELSGKKILLQSTEESRCNFEDSFFATVATLGGEASKDPDAEGKVHALVIDLAKHQDTNNLAGLYRKIHDNIKKIRKSGRLLVHCQKPKNNASLEAALSAFIKSMGRELGKYGTTANLIFSEEGSLENSAQSVLAWFLSDRSAFISGQVIQVEAQASNIDFESLQNGLLFERTAIVTGASRGIGLQIAKCFRREGAHVIGIDHPTQELELKDEMEGIDATYFLQDLADPSAVLKIKDFIHNGPGQIDIMIHNAGITRDRTIANMVPNEWDQVQQINYTFPSNMSAELLKPDSAIIPLIKDGGNIVYISSIVGIAGNFGQTNYAAAKGGLIGHTKDLYNQRYNANINTVACGFIETKMTEKIPPVMREFARRINALKQGGLPSDVAETTLFLCSNLGRGLSGQTIRVCGLHPAGA